MHSHTTFHVFLFDFINTAAFRVLGLFIVYRYWHISPFMHFTRHIIDYDITVMIHTPYHSLLSLYLVRRFLSSAAYSRLISFMADDSFHFHFLFSFIYSLISLNIAEISWNAFSHISNIFSNYGITEYAAIFTWYHRLPSADFASSSPSISHSVVSHFIDEDITSHIIKFLSLHLRRFSMPNISAHRFHLIYKFHFN